MPDCRRCIFIRARQFKPPYKPDSVRSSCLDRVDHLSWARIATRLMLSTRALAGRITPYEADILRHRPQRYAV